MDSRWRSRVPIKKSEVGEIWSLSKWWCHYDVLTSYPSSGSYDNINVSLISVFIPALSLNGSID